MRRLALVAAVLAVACSPSEEGDHTGPAAPVVTAPQDGALLGAADLVDGQVAFSGTAEPGAEVELEIDGTASPRVLADVNGSWAQPLSVAAGQHAVRARAIDAAGNGSAPSVTTSFTVDARLPAAPVLTSPAGPVVTNATDLVVAGTAEASATIRIRFGGTIVATTAADGAGDFTTAVALPGADGLVSLTAVAVDGAGNPSPPATAIPITIDRTPPLAPTVSAPAQGAFVATPSVQLAGTAEPGAAVRATADTGVSVDAAVDTIGGFSATMTLVEGARTVTVRATDAAGNFAETSRAFTVDTTVPAAPSITSPASGTATHGATLVVAGTAPADAALVRILDGGGVVATAAPAGTAFSATLSPAEGPHAYTAVAVDAAGNPSPASASVTVIVDRTAPASPLVVAPLDGAVLGAADLVVGQVRFSGTAEALSLVALEIDGVPSGATTADAEGSWSLRISVTQGAHTLRVRATDAAANPSLPSVLLAFTVDAVLPLAPVLTAPTGPVATNANDLLVSGTAEANVTIRLLLSGGLAGTTTAYGAGVFSTTIPLPGADVIVALTAVAIDEGGNISPPSAAVSIAIDRTAPGSPGIGSPLPGATLARADLVAGQVVFSGTSEPAARIALELDGAVAGTTDANASGAWTLSVPVADGAHAVLARATDRTGNASGPSEAVSFVLDSVLPGEPIVAAPLPSATLGAADLVGGEVVFSGSAEPGATVELELDGSLAGSAVASAAGAWSLPVLVADGTHAVRARAKDAAGNVSSFTIPASFTLDSVAPPPPVVVSPLHGALVVSTELVNGQVVVRGTAEAGASVDVLVDAATAGTFIGPDWSLAVTLSSGPHTVSARATDGVGNASSPSALVAFTVDTTRLATPLAAGARPPVTGWGQTGDVLGSDASGLGTLFPGQANSWVLAPDFSLARGFGLEYEDALLLYAGTPTAPPSHASLLSDLFGLLDPFPGDQSASEVVFLTPVFDRGDGVVTAAAAGALAADVPVLSGSYSGYLNGTSDSRLSRALTLTAGQTYTFTWAHRAVLQPGSLAGADAAPYAPAYQVVLRDPMTGAEIGAPLFSSSDGVEPASVSITRAGLPASVVLSFELRSAAWGFVQLDEVTLADGNGQIALANGDFEAGSLQGWLANEGAEAQNVRSGARTVGAGASALTVTRTFYAPPAAPWGRMVDVFENTGTAPVTTTIVYLTILRGLSPLAVRTQNGEAVIGWDAAATVRDVGIVFGNGTAYVADGDQSVFVVHDLTVPAGGKVALAHFVVQLGDTGGGTTTADVPAETDAECSAILAGYPTLEPYRVDFEEGVRALVTNL